MNMEKLTLYEMVAFCRIQMLFRCDILWIFIFNILNVLHIHPYLDL